MRLIFVALISVLLASSAVVNAEVVTKIEAERIAYNKLPGELRLVWGDEGDAFYVFNRGENEGFVIVAGDDRHEPIMAYALSGYFETNDMPDNLKEWMDSKDDEIKRLRRCDESYGPKRMPRVVGLGTKVLETPDWNQDEPYNGKCPIKSDFQFFTGCTITATAIVMGYHRWPEHGVGSLAGYRCRDVEMDVPGVTLGERYEWDKMPYLDGGDGPDLTNRESCDAVALIMQHLGVMLKAQYYWTETSASPEVLNVKLHRHFGYDENAMFLSHDKFSEERWQALLREEIDEGRPVIFAGYSAEYGGVGHSFVIDGYDDSGLFSVNWGWGGASNGFFNLQWLHPNDQGVGGYDGGYRHAQTAVTHLMPEGCKVERRERLQFTLTPYVGVGLNVKNASDKFEKGDCVTITVGMAMNLGTQRFTGETALVIADRWGRIKETIINTPERNVAAGTGWMPLDEWRDSVRVELKNDIDPGDRIRLVYRSEMTGEWCAVTSNEPESDWEIVLKKVPEVTTDVDDDKTDIFALYDVSGGVGCIDIKINCAKERWLVYDAGGVCVASGCGDARVALRSGIYFVKTDEETISVVVR